MGDKCDSIYYIFQGVLDIVISDGYLHHKVLDVLGKGSFAQVVSAIDHMSGKKVAVKINRNTEIDHKFAK